jgi:group I intron endonuclease
MTIIMMNSENYVYVIIFKNGKKYVGITTNNPTKRKIEHISCSRVAKPKYLLHKAIKLYGENSFEMNILSTTHDKDKLRLLEIKYIQEENTYFENGFGYNMSRGCEGNFGYKFTDEAKLKMSQFRKELFKNNPSILEKWKETMKNYWTEEKKMAMSLLKKEQHKNNPSIVEKWRESRGEWTDEQRKEQSLLKKEQFKNNPALAKEISNRNKIRGNTLEGKIRGKPKPFDVHNLNGEFIGTYNYVPFAVNDILNEKKLLNDTTEKTLGSSIRRVLSGERNHTKGFTFIYKINDH